MYYFSHVGTDAPEGINNPNKALWSASNLMLSHKTMAICHSFISLGSPPQQKGRIQSCQLSVLFGFDFADDNLQREIKVCWTLSPAAVFHKIISGRSF